MTLGRVAAARQLANAALAMVLVAACGSPAVSDMPDATADSPSRPGVQVQPSASAAPTPMTPAGWERFTSLRFGYSVGLPDGWLIEEVAGVGGVDPGEPGTDTFTGDNRILIISRVDLPPGTSLSAWRSPVAAHYEGPEPEGHGVTPREVRPVAIDGQQGRRLTYDVELGSLAQLILHAEAVVGDHGYLVTYIGLGDDEASYRAEFDLVLSSLDLPQ